MRIIFLYSKIITQKEREGAREGENYYCVEKIRFIFKMEIIRET